MSGTGRVLLGVLLAATLAISASSLAADIPAGREVAMGHLHYTVRDLSANLRFWTALGAEPVRFGELQAVQFPDLTIVLEQGDYSGLSEGAVVHHMAFRVQDLRTVVQAGFKLSYYEGYPGSASVLTPDGEMIELFDDTATNLWFRAEGDTADPVSARHNLPLPVPIATHHLHLNMPEDEVPKAQQWYVRHFGAVPGQRWNYAAADLPGINLNFSPPKHPGAVAPTRGRLLDHIGFEVRDLDGFCRRLTDTGVALDQPPAVGQGGLRSAFLTDPWGTRIELTETIPLPR